jgi:hypothetical protein
VSYLTRKQQKYFVLAEIKGEADGIEIHIVVKVWQKR